MPIKPFLGRGPRRAFTSTQAGVDTTPVVLSVSPNSGRLGGGLSVTITGQFFRVNADGTQPTVLFGTVPATSVTVVNSTTITCTTPIQTAVGSVDVTVTCGTQSGTLSDAFTYVTSTIQSVSPSFGPLAGGTYVTLLGYNFVTGSSVTLGGNAATGVTVVDDQHITFTTPSHAIGFVDIVVTEPGGATATLRNGFQYTLLIRGEDIRRTPGLQIQRSLGNMANTCTFTIDGQSNAPQVGEKIVITDPFDSNRQLFAGTVQQVEQIYEGQTGQLAWNVSCVGFTWLFNRRRPFGSWVGASATEVVTSLVEEYAPGFTTNHVQTNLAPVTVILDGTDDLCTVMTNIATAIGDGHWYVDDDQDVHFFHVQPSVTLPPSVMPTFTPGTSITLAEGSPIPSVFSYNAGYYFVRHTFVYSDGSETALGPISNVIKATGYNQLALTNIPLGPTVGTLTCIARRIYFNSFSGGSFPSQPIERVTEYCQINDNTTTSLTSWFGSLGAPAGVTDVPAGTPVPNMEFTSHPAAPAVAPTAVAELFQGNTWIGGLFQFRVAYLYRDGSVSYAGPASSSAGLVNSVNGTGIGGFNITGIPTGPTINGNDVVARFVYYCQGVNSNPNYSYSGTGDIPIGFVWPPAYLDPDWSQAETGPAIFIVPDNVTTQILNVSLGPLGLPSGFPTGSVGGLVGFGNLPYYDGSTQAQFAIPVWPWPDGPSLENVDPPGDIIDTNPDLLHEDTGSQGFSVTTDLSQVRNRIFVVGAGSTLAATANSGDTQLKISDASNFSPQGGKVRVIETGTGFLTVIPYNGITGVTGQYALTLPTALQVTIAQGASVNNFLQMDDVDSQKALGKVELDVNGKPTDGIHEYTVNDSTLKFVFQLYMAGFAQLELFAKPVVTIRYATRDPKSLPGQKVHVDLTDPPCQGDFLIQEVTVDQFHDESDQVTPRYTVTADSAVKFTLQDLLLLIGKGQNGPSTGGMIAAAVTDSAGSSNVSTPTQRWTGSTKLISAGFGNDGSTPQVENSGWTMGTSSNGGASTGRNDSTTYWYRFTTQLNGTLPNYAEFSFGSNNPWTWAIHNPTITFKIRTGPVIANTRIYLGLWNQVFNGGTNENFGPTPALDFPTSLVGVGVRFSPAVGSWTTFGCRGTTLQGGLPVLISLPADQVTIMGVAPNTIYTIQIAMNQSFTAITINGTQTQVPTPPQFATATDKSAYSPATGLMGMMTIVSTDSAQKILDWEAVYAERN